MAKGEIVIEEESCQGCGFCVKFCPQGCIEMGDKLNQKGYVVAQLADQQKCNACTICGWLCPAQAIEVYRYVEKVAREEV